MEYEHPGLLTYTLEKIGTGRLYFTILSQNEETVNRKGLSRDITHVKAAEGILSVGSSQIPEINQNCVWLRGRTSNNDNQSSIFISSRQSDIDNLYDKIVKSIDYWANLSRWDHLRGYPMKVPEQLSLWD